MHFPLVMRSSAYRGPVSVRPGPSVARRSSGAQPTKAKPKDVMSVYGRGVLDTVGAVLVLLELLLEVELLLVWVLNVVAVLDDVALEEVVLRELELLDVWLVEVVEVLGTPVLDDEL